MTPEDARKLRDWIKREAPDARTVLVCPSHPDSQTAYETGKTPDNTDISTTNTGGEG